MEREPRPEPIQLTGIHLNLDAQAIEFEDRHGTVGRLVFGGQVVLYEGQPLLLLPGGDPAEPSSPPGPDQAAASTSAPALRHKPVPRRPRKPL